MQEAIDILEIEIDSLKDAYKTVENETIKHLYAERILSCKKAIIKLKECIGEPYVVDNSQEKAILECKEYLNKALKSLEI